MFKKILLLSILVLSLSALAEESEADELRIGLKLGKGQSGLEINQEQALIQKISSEALINLFDGCLIKKEVKTESEIEFLAESETQEEVIELIETETETKLGECINSSAGQLSILGFNKIKVELTEEADKGVKLKLYFTTKLENMDLKLMLERVKAISSLPAYFTSELKIIKK